MRQTLAAVDAGRDTAAVAVVGCLVVDVTCGEGAGEQLVFFFRCTAVDDTASEVGVVVDLDVEAAVAGDDAALFSYTVEFAVGISVFGTGLRRHRITNAEWRHAQADAEAGTALLTVVDLAVLPAFDGEVATDFAVDGIAAHSAAAQIGVAAADAVEGIGGNHFAVALGGAVAIGNALGDIGAQL